jgi:hypothetical protein
VDPNADTEKRKFLTLPRLELRPLSRPARSIVGRDAVYSDKDPLRPGSRLGGGVQGVDTAAEKEHEEPKKSHYLSQGCRSVHW